MVPLQANIVINILYKCFIVNVAICGSSGTRDLPVITFFWILELYKLMFIVEYLAASWTDIAI
jgi:hypothetical protein